MLFIAMNIRAADSEQRTFEVVPESARAARQFIGQILRQRGASETTVRDYQLVVSELVANVIEHGDGSGLTVSSDFSDPEWWDIGVIGGEVVDENPIKQPEVWTVAGNGHVSGRGLGIVRQLMDDIVTDTSDDRHRVRCRRRRAEV